MAENVIPGLDGDMCIELDVLEANNWAMQTAIHTEQGGSFGSHKCDRNGCFARIGGPQSPEHLQQSYGPNKFINSLKPFNVESTVDDNGGLSIQLQQEHRTVTSFNSQMAGNPQGDGVPNEALQTIKSSQGKLALVVSLWSADLAWLDGTCNQCKLEEAFLTISNLHLGSPAIYPPPAPLPPRPPPLMPKPPPPSPPPPPPPSPSPLSPPSPSPPPPVSPSPSWPPPLQPPPMVPQLFGMDRSLVELGVSLGVLSAGFVLVGATTVALIACRRRHSGLSISPRMKGKAKSGSRRGAKSSSKSKASKSSTSSHSTRVKYGRVDVSANDPLCTSAEDWGGVVSV